MENKKTKEYKQVMENMADWIAFNHLKEIGINCPICDGYGFTTEHSNDVGSHNEDGECMGDCPVQEQCQNCNTTGKIKVSEDELNKIISLGYRELNKEKDELKTIKSDDIPF